MTPTTETPPRRAVWAFLRHFAALALLLWLTFGLCFGLMRVPDTAMVPALHAGDLILYERRPRQIRSGEVLVYEVQNTVHLGRVAAQAGDVVAVTPDAALMVNGSTVLETDIYFATPAFAGGPKYPLTLAQNELFLLADHRTDAYDSRSFGAVPAADVRGRVLAVLRRQGV